MAVRIAPEKDAGQAVRTTSQFQCGYDHADNRSWVKRSHQPDTGDAARFHWWADFKEDDKMQELAMDPRQQTIPSGRFP